MKRQRKKNLAKLMGENADDENDDKIKGLNKEQASYIMTHLGIIKEKFSSNN